MRAIARVNESSPACAALRGLCCRPEEEFPAMPSMCRDELDAYRYSSALVIQKVRDRDFDPQLQLRGELRPLIVPTLALKIFRRS